VRLKTLPPLILLLPLLTLSAYAQTPPESPGARSSGCGIEPGQLYPGSLVLELMEAAEAEIDAAVAEAYAEGYKAASLRFAPELAARNADIMSLNMAIEAFEIDRRKSRRNIFIAAGLSFLGGVAVGVIITRR